MAKQSYSIFIKCQINHLNIFNVLIPIMKKRISTLKEADVIASKSKLRQEDVEELAFKIDVEMSEHFKNLKRRNA